MVGFGQSKVGNKYYNPTTRKEETKEEQEARNAPERFFLGNAEVSKEEYRTGQNAVYMGARGGDTSLLTLTPELKAAVDVALNTTERKRTMTEAAANVSMFDQPIPEQTQTTQLQREQTQQEQPTQQPPYQERAQATQDVGKATGVKSETQNADLLDMVSAPLSQPEAFFGGGIFEGAKAVKKSREKIKGGDTTEAAKVIGTTILTSGAAIATFLYGGALVKAVGGLLKTKVVGATAKTILGVSGVVGVNQLAENRYSNYEKRIEEVSKIQDNILDFASAGGDAAESARRLNELDDYILTTEKEMKQFDILAIKSKITGKDKLLQLKIQNNKEDSRTIRAKLRIFYANPTPLNLQALLDLQEEMKDG